MGEVESQSVSCSVMSDSAAPQTVAGQAPLSTGFSSQEYWSGLPCPPPGDLPNPAIKPASPALWVDPLPSELPGSGMTERVREKKGKYLKLEKTAVLSLLVITAFLVNT